MTADLGIGFGDLINPDNVYTADYVARKKLQSDRAFLNPKGSGAVVSTLKKYREGLRRGLKNLNRSE